jgi:hypothetical protein
MNQMADSLAQKSLPAPVERILSAPAARRMKALLNALVDDLLLHEGFGKIELDMKILTRRQKEIIVRGSKEHRFVLDFMNDGARVESLPERRERQGCPYGVRGPEQSTQSTAATRV